VSSRPVFPAGYPFWSDLWIRSGWRVQQREGACRLLDPGNRVVHAGSRTECVAVGRGLAPRAKAARAVILLHGIVQWRRSLWRLGDRLAERGWAVADAGYASLTRPFGSHVHALRGIADALVEDGAGTVSIVGHSLGGLIGRAAMSASWPDGRLVQLGTPNHGSALAAKLDRAGLLRRLFGPCAEILLPGAPDRLPIPECPILVVAGGREGRGWNPLLDGDNDGTVRVTETRLEAPNATHFVVRSPHVWLPHQRDAVAAAIEFLEAPHWQPAPRIEDDR
jgi:hypothetical protein